jgi:hypothetical protein
MSEIDINNAEHPIRKLAIDIMESIHHITGKDIITIADCWFPVEDMIVERILDFEKSKEVAKKKR